MKRIRTSALPPKRIVTLAKACGACLGLATLDVDWDSTPTGTVVYEVLPQYSLLLKHLACLAAALDILSIEASSKRIATLEKRFVVKQRAIRMAMQKKQSRFPSHAEGDTVDNYNRNLYLGRWL